METSEMRPQSEATPAPGGERGARRRVVVGVDGSESSKEALRYAAVLAPALDATVEAVIAWKFPETYGWPVSYDEWRPDEDAAKVLQTALDEVFDSQRPLGLETVVKQGHARDVLLAASEDAEMLVVGSRGRGGFAEMLLGSVSAACVEHAPCPVLVVHTRSSQ